MKISEITYHPDSTRIFAAILSEKLSYPLFLDSCWPYQPEGRYDILAANPETIINTRGFQSIIETQNDCDGLRITNQDLFSLTQEYLEKFSIDSENEESVANNELPFLLGAMGFWGYDLARRLENLNDTIISDIDLPDAYIGIYPWTIIVDHHQQKTVLVQKNSSTRLPDFLQQNIHASFFSKPELMLQENLLPTPENLMLEKAFSTNISPTIYYQNCYRLQQYLGENNRGHIYFSQRFSSQHQGNPWRTYQFLRRQLPSPYTAFIRHPKGDILSLSAQQFIQLKNKKALEFFRACFPAKLITGTSKINSMEMLEQVEAQRRSLHSGCIGYCDSRGNLDSNISMNTFITCQKNIHYYSGSVIKIDTEIEKEYEKILKEIKCFMPLTSSYY